MQARRPLRDALRARMAALARGAQGEAPWIALLILGFAAVRVVAWLNGLRFDTNAFYYWHVLDEDLLRDDLVRSIHALHAQPPLYNLLFGVALQALPEPAFGPVVATVYRLLSLAGMIGSRGLLRELGVGRATAAAIALLVWCSPTVLAYENNLFYTTPVTALLTLAAWMLARAARTGRRAPLWGFATCVVALAWTRATFHPVWVVLAFVPALLVVSLRRQALVAAAVAVVLVGALCVKNGLLVGSWATSSWLGMNLARMTTDRIPRPERRAWVKSGGFDPVCVPGSFSSVNNYPKSRIEIRGPDLPALRRVLKKDGSANYNHAGIADVSRHYRACAVRVIRERPSVYRAALREAFVAFLKPPIDWFIIYPQKVALGRYSRFYARWILGARSTGVSWQYFVFLACALGAAVAAAAGKLADARQRLPPLLFASGTVVFLSCVSVFGDVGENMRFRGELEPLLQTVGLFVLVALAGAARARWRTFRRRPGRDTQGA